MTVARLSIALALASIPLGGLLLSFYLDPHMGSIPQYSFPKLLTVTFVNVFLVIYSCFRSKSIASVIPTTSTALKLVFFGGSFWAALSALQAAIRNFRMFENLVALTSVIRADAQMLWIIAAIALLIRHLEPLHFGDLGTHPR